MRLKVVLASLTCAFAWGVSSPAKAQVVTATPDSVLISTPAVAPPEKDTTARGPFIKPFHTWSRPAKAAFYSGVLPGLGQAYNKSYWKIPLVYATGGVIGYFIYDNNKKYQSFSRALEIRLDKNPNTVDEYVDHLQYGVNAPSGQGDNNLRRARDFFRKYRDLDIILAFLAYGLNMMEAHVDAHLQAFDVSDELSLQLKPNLIPMVGTQSYTPALTLQFNLKR